MYDPKFVQAGRQLMELRIERDRLKKEAEASEKAFREAETEFYELMEEGGAIGTQKIDLGEPYGVVGFLNRKTFYGRIVDQDKALQYYEQRAMTDEVTAPQFVKKRINDEVRDCIEQGKDLPPGVDYYSRTGVTITRQKS